MPPPSEFPHLSLAYRGQFEPKFRGGRHKNPEVAQNKADPVAALSGKRETHKALQPFHQCQHPVSEAAYECLGRKIG